MVNLIESIITAGNTNRPTYAAIRNQVIGFLLHAKPKDHPHKWFRALLGVISPQTKVSLMHDLLTLANSLLETRCVEKLIRAALETIYPNSVRSHVATEIKSNKEHDNHDYIPYNPRRFAQVVSRWSKELHKGVDFIDVGCGIGDKLVLAKYFVKQVKSITGVEINTHTYNLGKFFLNGVERWFTLPFEIIEGDAFDVDYSKYNLIYMFQPIAKRKRMIKLYTYILKTMPVDAIMIEVLPVYEYDKAGVVKALPLLDDQEKFKQLNEDRYLLVVKKIA